MKDTLFKKILYRNILLSILSLGFTIGIGMFFLYQFTHENIKDDNQRVANVVSLRIDNFMTLAIERAEYIANQKELLYSNSNLALERYFKVSLVYDSICLINTKGQVLNSYPHKETYDKNLIMEMARKKFSYTISTSKNHLVIFTPVKDTAGNNKFILAFNLERDENKFFNKLLVQSKDKFGGTGFVIDEKGTILFHSNKSELNNKLQIRDILSVIENNKRVEGNNSLISATSKIPKTNWYAVVETPLKNVISPLYSLVFVIISIFFGMFILYAVISYYSLKRVLKPIRDLISEMTAFPEFDYYRPIPVKGSGEIAYLYEAFNMMILRLKRAWDIEQETFEELKRAEKLSVVGELAAGSAHEIRNPLTTIKGFIQLFYENGNKISPEHKDLIFSELERIEQITNEFLMLSKPQMKVFGCYKVRDIIEQVYQMIEDEAVLNKVEILNQVNCSCQIYCEMPQIKQVFLNISRNAIQAMPKGGKLTIECIDDETNEGRYISFTDTGPGIPKENLDKLDQPFFTTKSYGTGLGLTVTYRIIQNHRGNITVNTSSKGTSFIIWLPVSPKTGS